jgi:hypothetical protein
MLCILALLPFVFAESTPPLAAALADARMAEPDAIARALIEVIRIDPTKEGGWLADLRGFDGPERQELSDLLRKEGVGLADRSKLRRLANAAARTTAMGDEVVSIPRRAQQADGRKDESTTNKQLKQQQGDHAGTAQSSSEPADGGSGLNGDSAYPYLSLAFTLARRT